MTSESDKCFGGFWSKNWGQNWYS